MKNATEYGKKVKRMLPALRKRLSALTPPEGLEPLEVFIVGVLREDSSLVAALKATEVMHEEFFDYNEIRVAPAKDITDLLDRNMGKLRSKAEQITGGLNRIYDHGNRLDFEHTADMGKRELQAHLREALELSPFVEAYLVLYLFGHRAMPVDACLVERLKGDGLVHPDATDDAVRVLLERIVPPKDQIATYELLAQYAQEAVKPKPKTKKTVAKKATTKKASAKKATTTKAKPKAAAKTGSAKKTAAKKPAAKKTTKAKAPKKTANKAAKKAAKKTSKPTKAKSKRK